MRIKTTRSNGREPGFHEEVYQKYLTKLLAKKKNKAEFIAMGSSGNGFSVRKELIDTARESSYGKFPSYVLICNLDNDRDKQLKNN